VSLSKLFPPPPPVASHLCDWRPRQGSKRRRSTPFCGSAKTNQPMTGHPVGDGGVERRPRRGLARRSNLPLRHLPLFPPIPGRPSLSPSPVLAHVIPFPCAGAASQGPLSRKTTPRLGPDQHIGVCRRRHPRLPRLREPSLFPGWICSHTRQGLGVTDGSPLLPTLPPNVRNLFLRHRTPCTGTGPPTTGLPRHCPTTPQFGHRAIFSFLRRFSKDVYFHRRLYFCRRPTMGSRTELRRSRSPIGRGPRGYLPRPGVTICPSLNNVITGLVAAVSPRAGD